MPGHLGPIVTACTPGELDVVEQLVQIKGCINFGCLHEVVLHFMEEGNQLSSAQDPREVIYI